MSKVVVQTIQAHESTNVASLWSLFEDQKILVLSEVNVIDHQRQHTLHDVSPKKIKEKKEDIYT